MANKEPVSETKRIQPTHGPYAHSHIDIPTADADAAIADGWAIDPYAPVDPKAEPKVLTDEDHANANAAAEAAARKFRGEDQPKSAAAAKPAVKKSGDDDDAASGGDAGYQTRQAKPASAAPAPAPKPATAPAAGASAAAPAPASTAAKSTK